MKWFRERRDKIRSRKSRFLKVFGDFCRRGRKNRKVGCYESEEIVLERR